MRGVGTDIIEVGRIEKVIRRFDARFLDRIFSLQEQNYCLKYRDAARHFAGRFAAKEAVVKALGTGFSGEVGWLDIEIINDPSGKPSVRLSQQVQKLFHSPHVLISISHCHEYATAFAVCL